VGIKLGRERINDKQNDRDDAALQNGLWVTEVIERVAVESRVAVKVSLLPDLRPRRVDAERDQREEQIDDPDPEVLAGGTRELGTNDADLRSRSIKRRGCGTCVRSPISIFCRLPLSDDAPRILCVFRIRPEKSLSLVNGLTISCALMTTEYRIRTEIA
jgi:hypothetical protein